MKKIFTLIALCALVAAFSAIAQASLVYGTDVHTGDFTNKSNVLQFNFTITEEQAVWIFTDSYYKNSVNAGFILWNADTGKMVGAIENGNVSYVNHADTSKDNGKSQVYANDAVLIRNSLAAGNYIVTLVPTFDGQAIDNFRFNSIAELENYRAKFAGSFSGEFSLNIVYKGGGQPPVVPIPASALLLAPGIAAIGVLRRKLS